MLLTISRYLILLHLLQLTRRQERNVFCSCSAFSARRHELTAAAGDVVIFDLRTISFLAQHVSARRHGLVFWCDAMSWPRSFFFCRLVSISCATPWAARYSCGSMFFALCLWLFRRCRVSQTIRIANRLKTTHRTIEPTPMQHAEPTRERMESTRSIVGQRRETNLNDAARTTRTVLERIVPSRIRSSRLYGSTGAQHGYMESNTATHGTKSKQHMIWLYRMDV